MCVQKMPDVSSTDSEHILGTKRLEDDRERDRKFCFDVVDDVMDVQACLARSRDLGAVCLGQPWRDVVLAKLKM